MTARVKAQGGSSGSCSDASIYCCCPAWQSPAPRILLPLIWFTKGDCLNGAASSWSVSSLLEAFLTPISWLDSFFKSFFRWSGFESHLPFGSFLNCMASLRSFRERIYLQLCHRVDQLNKIFCTWSRNIEDFPWLWQSRNLLSSLNQISTAWINDHFNLIQQVVLDHLCQHLF